MVVRVTPDQQDTEASVVVVLHIFGKPGPDRDLSKITT